MRRIRKIRSIICDLQNLTFSPSFFRDEVREGFYVSTMMKRYWASQLKVLSLVAQICKKHDIPWYSDYGTTLGAVRHAGYVPWDDDFDICMMRDDWERFFSIAAKELPEDFEVLTIDLEPEYDQVIGRIVNGHSIDFGPERMREFYGCPYTVGIDIFPLDGLYSDEDKEKGRLIRAKKATSDYTEAGGSVSLAIGKRQADHSGKRRRLLEKIQEIYRECPTAEAKDVALMPFYVSNGTHIFPKELYKDVVKLPFENTYIDVPARYDELLELQYGDYLHVYKEGGIHEYPVYAAQEQMLREHLGHNPYHYTLDSNELLRSVQRYVLRMAGKLGNAGTTFTENHNTSDVIRDSTDDGANETTRKIVAFLPCRVSWWSTMEPLWRAYSENPEYEVHVLPIFYYDCDYTGAVFTENKHDERALFPEYVHVEDCEKFDFAGIHPDVIVIQVPYDGYSTAMTVHEFFYSANLLNFTDELIYVPCFDIDPPEEEGDKASVAIKGFIEQEAVINADKVVLSSKELAGFYADTLISMTGAETAQYWQQKITVLEDEIEGLSVESETERCVRTEDSRNMERTSIQREKRIEDKEKYGAINQCEDQQADSWCEFLGNQYGKKVMVYYITISFILRHREKAIEKIKRSMETFSEAGDKICAIIVPQSQILTDLERIDENLWERYSEIFTKYQSRNTSSDGYVDSNATRDKCCDNANATSANIIYDEKGFSLGYMSNWNGYYGDASPLVRECILRKIPVMIENADV